MSKFKMLMASGCLPGFEGTKTYAAWPVWSGSTTAEIKFQPMPKKAATRLFHRARDFDRQTKVKGKHGGALGHTALQVLHTLLFDFLNYTSGRLDPSYAAIARKANVCQRAVATALAKLRAYGVLNWVRRCAEGRREDGRFMLQQETNAYAVLPCTQWAQLTGSPKNGQHLERRMNIVADFSCHCRGQRNSILQRVSR